MATTTTGTSGNNGGGGSPSEDKQAFTNQPGTAIECLSIPITLNKDPVIDSDGNEVLKCGFRIGGGIDQNYQQSPQGYSDNGIYVTDISPESAASRSGLRIHDKILQCNGYDFTMVGSQWSNMQICIVSSE